jgi:co-chaperonin GroES (HSP10)
MASNINSIKGKPRAIGNRVLVTDMYFGEQTTKGGIILGNDDGKTRGIYPRWAKVYSKGPENKDPYEVGNWILIEHGRWTRGMKMNVEDEEIEVRMVETESILAMSNEKPDSVQIGAEYADGEHATVDPSAFMGQQY